MNFLGALTISLCLSVAFIYIFLFSIKLGKYLGDHVVVPMYMLGAGCRVALGLTATFIIAMIFKGAIIWFVFLLLPQVIALTAYEINFLIKHFKLHVIWFGSLSK